VAVLVLKARDFEADSKGFGFDRARMKDMYKAMAVTMTTSRE
jgi:hypothetical protein